MAKKTPTVTLEAATSDAHARLAAMRAEGRLGERDTVLALLVDAVVGDTPAPAPVDGGDGGEKAADGDAPTA